MFFILPALFLPSLPLLSVLLLPVHESADVSLRLSFTLPAFAESTCGNIATLVSRPSVVALCDEQNGRSPNQDNKWEGGGGEKY